MKDNNYMGHDDVMDIKNKSQMSHCHGIFHKESKRKKMTSTNKNALTILNGQVTRVNSIRSKGKNYRSINRSTSEKKKVVVYK